MFVGVEGCYEEASCVCCYKVERYKVRCGLKNERCKSYRRQRVDLKIQQVCRRVEAELD